MRIRNLVHFFVGAAIALAPLSVSAAELEIYDADGTLRQTSEVAEGERPNLRIEVDGAAADASSTVTLTPVGGGSADAITVVVENGVAEFAAIPAGQYTVTTTVGLELVSFQVIGAGAALAGGGALAGGAALLAVGGGAVAISNSNDDDSTDRPDNTDGPPPIVSRFR